MKAKSFNAVRLAQIRETMKALKAEAAELKEIVAQEKANMAEARQVAKERRMMATAERRAAAIAKAEARLARLLEKQSAPVGVKALRANRKPGKVKVVEVPDILMA